MASADLQVIEQAQIDTHVGAEHVAFCDAHDLIAIVKAGNISEAPVTVYRLKGEAAFHITPRDDEDLRPLSLQWKPDGSLLAVTWSDEVCCLYSGENGKLLYELPTKQTKAGDDASWGLDINVQPFAGGSSDVGEAHVEDGASRSPITWTSYEDGQKRRKSSLENGQDMSTEIFFDGLDGRLANGTHPPKERPDSAIADLINSITTLDTTSVLPRLAKIETASGMRFSPEGNKFSTQASTDTIFDASTFAPGIFSTLLASDMNGYITAFVDETIKVGHVQLPQFEQLKSASRSQCQSQVILTRHADDSHHLNFIDLPLERLGSPLNYVVSLNTRRLQSLTAYVTHTIRCIHQEIQTGIKGVPARMMKLLEEDLRSASPSETTAADLAPIALQHLALTTNFSPIMLEWLKDIVKETGHKRWDQATNAMYEHIQSYLFKNLLPALQRFSAAVCALRGQAKFHQHTDRFSMRGEVFEDMLLWADTFELVAQKTLAVVVEEQVQFRAFSKWLRVMIDVAVAGPGSKSADETEERESPNFDVDLVLRYIRGPLGSSLLKVLAESSPPAGQAMVGREEFFEHPIITGMERQKTVASLARLDGQEKGQLEPRSRSDDDAVLQEADTINLPLIACVLKAHTRIAIDEINQWQSQAVTRSPDTLLLDPADPRKVHDMAISSDKSQQARETVEILYSPSPSSSGQEGGLKVLRVQRQKARNRAPRFETFGVPLPADDSGSGGEILQAAFLADAEGRNDIIALTHHPSSEEHDTFTLSLLTLIPTPDDRDRNARTLFTWPTSPSTPSFLPSPTHFLIGGRAGKRVIVVFSPTSKGNTSKGTRWQVLDLESVNTAGAGQRGDEDEGDVEMY